MTVFTSYRFFQILFSSIFAYSACLAAEPQAVARFEPIKYGDFEQWVTRNISESVVIGGHQKKIYAIAPEAIINDNIPYTNQGGSPWGTSNVYAKVSGVTKGSNAVYPHQRVPGNMCAMLCTQIESVKVLGVINMNVMVTGSIFLGQMIEPISSTKEPYKKMIMGIPYSKRPDCLIFDFMVDIPLNAGRIKSTGFGRRKELEGTDAAMAFVLLQRRWEDSEGNIYAKRVGTGGELFQKSYQWQKRHQIPITYGDASKSLSWLPLRSGENAYYARNSRGEMVPVNEVGYDSPDATPTHIVMMFSSGSSEPYVGTLGLTMYVDNVGLGFY